ncbi:hypothetical protein B0T10DRAFT_502083 [Thelonectria olida]|uniref:Zn(2)-C6 fungal-type domain-containing protein n=1 Tax=Thelonectria olida TaxID=1576542 RepID=A0A9P9AHF7_9HYPO|nr:hypothetical protein B0T10DRAFT_502083 [Thelonectria olida]
MDQQSIDPGHEGGERPASDDLARRACDQCRTRKIRCDKELPCSNCRTAERSCTSIGVGKRPREPRQRVLISSQYEHKVDQIEIRLNNIETLVRNLPQRLAFTTGCNFLLPGIPHLSTGNSSGAGTAAGSTIDYASSGDESAIGGDSFLTSHTTHASELLVNAVERTSLHDSNPEMREALSSLRHLVELQAHQSISCGPRFPLQQRIPVGGLGQLPMPPMDVVVRLLKQIRASSPGLFTFVCSFVGVSDFAKLCRLVYFSTDDFTDATFVIVNAGLYYLFLEQHTLAPGKATKDELEPLIQLCRINLETSLANVSLFMSLKIESVQALLLGTLYAIDVSRPTVAWHLNCAAAQICQTAGFHRQEQLKRDPATSDVKSTLFWCIYTQDKALGLRLGRAPAIQDWDVDVPRAFNFETTMSLEMSGVAMMWVRLATLQGHLYERLYSPAALAQPHSELAERARMLGAECRQVELDAIEYRGRAVSSLKKIGTSPLVDIYVKGDEVQLLSTITLIYRAIPPPEGSNSGFSDECDDAARRAMQQHLSCMELVQRDALAKSIYLHWNLVLTPFAPFFVIFCYVIETLSAEDLRLLKAFSASLEAAIDSSETVQKLWHLWQVMSNVATLYVEAKSQTQEDEAMVPIGDQFDVYLSQLGLLPVVQTAIDATGTPDATVVKSSQVTHIANWMSGSRNMMGLLEQDISQIWAQEWQQGSM